MLKKKCYICKSYFNISDINQGDYVCDKKGKKFSHFDCELDLRKNKNDTKKIGKLHSDEMLKRLIQDQKKSIDIIRIEFGIQNLYEFIYTNYKIVSIPIPIKNKIQKLIEGNIEGISKPICPEEIIDMWKRQKSQLDKLYQYNKTKGKEMDRVARVGYDLAVLIGKYDSYLEWKEKERIRALSTSQTLEILETSISNYAKCETQNENEIADILDDLF